jgi:hypothetical protein
MVDVGDLAAGDLAITVDALPGAANAALVCVSKWLRAQVKAGRVATNEAMVRLGVNCRSGC